MGLFFKKKKQGNMDVPPPPPEEEGEKEMPERTAPMLKAESKPNVEIPELPPLGAEEPEQEMHLESDLPEIKPAEAKMPEFPEAPSEYEKDEEPAEEEPEEAPSEYRKKEEPAAEMPEAEFEMGPKFVNITSFQQINDEANAMKASLSEVENSIKELNAIKTEEEKEFQKWRSSLEDIEKKLSYVDRVIFKGA